MRALYEFRNPRLQFIDANPGLTLRLLRRALQPQVINLGENPVLPRHPPVTKRFQFRQAVEAPLSEEWQET